MKEIKKRRTSLTEEERDEIIKIYESDMEIEEKREKSYNIIKPEDLEYIKEYASRNCIFIRIESHKKIFEIYEEYKPKYKKMYRCRCPYELEKRIKNLKIIHEVLKSDKPREEKVKIIVELGMELKNFKNKYMYMLQKGMDDPALELIQDALKDLDFIVEELEKITEREKIIAKNNYIINYNYAKFVIEEYINGSRSHIKNDFLQAMGISNEIFEYCEKLIKYMEPDLYKKYEERVSENNIKRFNTNKITILNLYKGIKNGFLSDGTKFDIFEFYKRVPFVNNANFLCILIDFIKRNMHNPNFLIQTIIDYLKSQGNYSLARVNEKTIHKCYPEQLEQDLVNNVFRYMRINKLPYIYQVFCKVLEKHLNNEIDFSLLDEQEKNYKEKIESNKYNNPYKLVLK